MLPTETASIETEPKLTSAPQCHQTEHRACVTYLYVSLQVIVVQGLEGAGIHLHCFRVEDHLDSYKVRKNFLWGEKPKTQKEHSQKESPGDGHPTCRQTGG